ncbi:hypothetical protein AJ87_48490 [Rhizobium yanglingense]|nr:hypothetical protein AJ87_48490 [Rhizobium yanglingense]
MPHFTSTLKGHSHEQRRADHPFRRSITLHSDRRCAFGANAGTVKASELAAYIVQKGQTLVVPSE